MNSEKAFTIRSYRESDREAVRRLCCQTGFLGEPIDPVYEDRQLFADFLTTYYTDHEPESSFVLEVDGEIRGYLLGSRRPLQNQLYSLLAKRLALFQSADSLFSLQRTLAPVHSLDACARLARSAGGAPARSAFPHQSAAGCAQNVDHTRA